MFAFLFYVVLFLAWTSLVYAVGYDTGRTSPSRVVTREPPEPRA